VFGVIVNKQIFNFGVKPHSNISINGETMRQ